MSTPRPRIALTCGDPAGVGPEVLARWLADPARPEADYTLIGPRRWLASLPAMPACAQIAVGPADFIATPGRPEKSGADVAQQALEEAAAGCPEGRWDAVVTGPVSKEWMRKAGWNYPGQTEFFAERWGGRPVMAFAGERLRLVLATWHIPLRSVFEALDFETLEAAVTAAAVLATGCLDTPPAVPRIGVCGLNPHAGEAGLLGEEERARLDPWLKRLRASHPGVSTCQPADTVFWRALRGEFDVLVALYHDQGLAPLKTLEFETAVNVTLGLPWVRTSPDHGTGFDIAGKGTASHRSFSHAVRLAARLAARRRMPAFGVL